MGIVRTNWEVVLSRKLCVCLVLVTIVSSLSLLIAWAAGFGTWVCLLDAALLWIPTLFWLGVVAHNFQYKLIDKPLSFCLPGYRQSLRGLYFTAALPAGVIGSLFVVTFFPYGPFEVFEEMSPVTPGGQEVTDGFSRFLRYAYWFGCPVVLEGCLRATAGFTVGTALALSAQTARLAFPRRSVYVVAVASLLVYFLGGSFFVAGFFFPLAVWPVLILIGFFTCVVIWFRLGDMTAVAHGHRAIIASTAQRRRIGSGRRVHAWIEHLFVDSMERSSHGRSRQYLWGSLYCALGPVLSRWKRYLIGLLGVVWVAASNRWAGAGVVLAVFAFAIARIDLPIASNLLLPAGRRERYRATVVAMWGVSFVLALAGAGSVLLSQFIVRFMPHHWDVEYTAVGFSIALLPAVLVSWLFGFDLLGRTAPGIVRTALRVVVGVLVIVSVFLNVAFSRGMRVAHLVFFIGLFSSGWVFFLQVLKYVCTKGSLGTMASRGGRWEGV